MTEPFAKSFFHTVIEDVVTAFERFEQSDTPTHRRECIRAISAAIEGLNFYVKRTVLKSAAAKLSVHEHAAMLEESFTMDTRGVVHAQPRYVPLISAVRLVVRSLKRIRPGYEIDLNHPAWGYLKETISVRNRLVHPKNIDDLHVTVDEVAKANAAFHWFLAYAIESQQETIQHYKELAALMPTVRDSNPQTGNSE